MPVWVETINFDEGVGGGRFQKRLKLGIKLRVWNRSRLPRVGGAQFLPAQDTAEVAKKKAELPHLLGKSRSPAG